MPMIFSEHSPLSWIGFGCLILIILALDLNIFNRRARAIPVREALWKTAAYIVLALCFDAWIYWQSGRDKAVEFLTGYVVEYALSMDNILVFVVILAYFQVPVQSQMRVLLWGIIGAMVLRAIFIFAGLALLDRFDWMVIVLGVFLIITGLRTMREGGEPPDLKNSRMIRLLRRFIPVTASFDGTKFFTRNPSGKAFATPLFLVLIVLNIIDIMFAFELGSRRICDYTRSLHCLYIERIRHPWLTGALFRSVGDDRQVSLLEVRPFACPDLHWHQDDLQLPGLARGYSQ